MADDPAAVKAWNARLVAYVKTLDHEATRRGSQLRFTYKSVARALVDYPTRVTTAAEAQQIKGVGPAIGRQLEHFINKTLLPEQHQQATQQPTAAAAAAAAAVAAADNGGRGGGGGGNAGWGLGEEEGSRDSLNEMMEDLGMASQSTASYADMDAINPSVAEGKTSNSSSSSSMRGRKGVESSRAGASKAASASSGLNAKTILLLSDDDDEDEDEEEEGGQGGGGEDKENMHGLPNTAGWASMRQRQQQQQQSSSVVVEVIDVSEDEDEDEDEEKEQAYHRPNSKAGGKGDDEDDEEVLVLMSDSDEDEEEEEEEFKERSNNDHHTTSPTPPPPPALPAPLPSLPPSSSSKGKGRKRKLFSPPKAYKQFQLGFGGGKFSLVEEGGEDEDEEEEEEDLEGPMTLKRLNRLCRHFEGSKVEEWEVVLLLDRREHENNPSIERGLVQAGVRCEVRVLQLGDMLWVVRRRLLLSSSSSGGSKEEEKARKEREKQGVMLRYVIERKTVGDLAASIKDGRYKEQKGRMLGVGKEVDRAFYLVEGTFEQLNDVIRPPALRTALATTQIMHGLPVLRTMTVDQTIGMLRRMHVRIQEGVGLFLRTACEKVGDGDGGVAAGAGGGGGGEGAGGKGGRRRAEYLEKHLSALPLPPSRIISLGEYQERCKKTAGDLTVRSMFLVQLCAIDKVSEAKSKAVVGVYPTPIALARAMRGMSEEEAVAALAGLPVSGHRQSLGRVAAVNIYNVYR